MRGAKRKTAEAPPAGVLPDTCAWIDFFSGKDSPAKIALAAALKSATVYTCGPVLFELLQGTRSERDRELLLTAHRSLEYAEPTPAVWLRAGDLSAELRRTGTTIPFSDLLIAALAIENRLEIITADRHFMLVPGVRTHQAALQEPST